MLCSPVDDVLRLVDDRPVIEDERRDLVAARQALDLAPSAEESVGAIAPVGPYDVGLKASRRECPVGPRAGMALSRAEGAVADV